MLKINLPNTRAILPKKPLAGNFSAKTKPLSYDCISFKAKSEEQKAIDECFKKLKAQGLQIEREDVEYAAKKLGGNVNLVKNLSDKDKNNKRVNFIYCYILAKMLDRGAFDEDDVYSDMGKYIPDREILENADWFFDKILPSCLDMKFYGYEILAEVISRGEISASSTDKAMEGIESLKKCDLEYISKHPANCAEIINALACGQDFRLYRFSKLDELERKLFQKCMFWKNETDESQALSYCEGFAPKYGQYKDIQIMREIRSLDKCRAVAEDDVFSNLYKQGLIDANGIRLISKLPQKDREDLKEAFRNPEFKEKYKNCLNREEEVSIGVKLLTLKVEFDCKDKLFNWHAPSDKVCRLNKYDALAIRYTERVYTIYSAILSQGYDVDLSAIASNIKDIENMDIAQVIRFLGNIGAKSSNTRLSTVLSEYFEENKELDLKELNDYIEALDIPKLKKLAPDIEEYDSVQLLKFFTHFYRENKTDFSAQDLTFGEDLSEYLSQNYLDKKSLGDLLTLYPLTNRRVGQIPKFWLEGIEKEKQKEAEDSIYQAFEEFALKRDTRELEDVLMDILKKHVTIDELNGGRYGIGYRITTYGSSSVCLKVFNSTNTKKDGVHAEVQAGLFANRHSGDFVKMFFGKVAPENRKDGFIVTQYLDEGIEPIEEDYVKNCKVVSMDAWIGHNIINGKITDFGAIRVLPLKVKISKQPIGAAFQV